MKDTITVYFDGQGLIVRTCVAEKFGLKHGDTIPTEDTFWRVLRAKGSHMISVCEHKLMQNDN